MLPIIFISLCIDDTFERGDCISLPIESSEILIVKSFDLIAFILISIFLVILKFIFISFFINILTSLINFFLSLLLQYKYSFLYSF